MAAVHRAAEPNQYDEREAAVGWSHEVLYLVTDVDARVLSAA